MTSATKPEALISSPAEATVCPTCLTWVYAEDLDEEIPVTVTGVRYPGDTPGSTFAHCPECGTTDLLDTRSPFEVFVEARRNVEEAQVGLRPVEVIMERQDAAARVRKIAEATSVGHCSDCSAWAARAALEVAAMA